MSFIRFHQAISILKQCMLFTTYGLDLRQLKGYFLKMYTKWNYQYCVYNTQHTNSFMPVCRFKAKYKLCRSSTFSIKYKGKIYKGNEYTIIRCPVILILFLLSFFVFFYSYWNLCWILIIFKDVLRIIWAF